MYDMSVRVAPPLDRYDIHGPRSTHVVLRVASCPHFHSLSRVGSYDGLPCGL
ncbi:hypothetical protein BJV78DRAFT_1210552 [Lactifluus subvellereus]|nr:hypothetical protein BJV78DRAFT_1210552 [Lactifluus subvellereus]